MITVETIDQNYLDKTGQKAPAWLTSEWEWQDIVWKKIEFEVFNLQKRIYKATKAGQLKQAKALSKLLLRSSCSIILNVRRITQDNSGKKTAGIDRVKLSCKTNKNGMDTKKQKWVLDADIKGCFDNIDHKHLFSLIDGKVAKVTINQWLKAGVMENDGTTPRANQSSKIR
ncbi:reverse transcriptase N-terminal domain-containing protein [Candidatus Marithrix sp. Canyon 246]|uniref:reverse transcriptase N-terminal domain-containing protein n=1 Tax=Candidatus Marithrix sp. Canyon 246 TaxID=1827136 RepID=UPI000849F82F|nr:reverse transcriptase N-terminal domain-containing protein [Candidatus Marithrix sp. Canyon 246]